MKKRENFPPKLLGDFFRGGRILGDVCGGNLGGNFWGKCKKRGGTTVQKDFLGGSYTGGRVWGECWEIKDKIGGKKISGGQKFCGGTFGGNAKKGWKNCFGGVLGEL